MNTEILKIAIRNSAIYINDDWIESDYDYKINTTTAVLLANCRTLGYTFSETLLHQVNNISPQSKLAILDAIQEVTGVKKNWTPLVKQWDIPTNEKKSDHFITYITNLLGIKKGSTLACGHNIPEDTFPLERYNGCPFCGTPFETEDLKYKTDFSKLKILDLWTNKDVKKQLDNLLTSPVALDATQIDSLKTILTVIDLPVNVKVSMKETVMIVIDTLLEQNKADIVGGLFRTPNDILRYLWYKHTGFLQLVEPKTIAQQITRNNKNYSTQIDDSTNAKIQSISELKLKYRRNQCKQVAMWLNNLKMDIDKQCEIMHPKRSMWVRFIRALRLAEYARRKGFENLAQLMDVFYNKNYDVWQGRVNHYKLKADAQNTFRLLKKRPGLFARSLFSTMLWFGEQETIEHFKEVMNEIPLRLIFTLNMYADLYFDVEGARSIKTLSGITKRIPKNRMLNLYSSEQLFSMKKAIQDLSLEAMKSKWKNMEYEYKTIYIDKDLFNIPIAIGDRVDSLQDLGGALMGTKFSLEGNKVRLFLQWGVGLSACHLDMDLSCSVLYEDKTENCSYSQLTITGCKHSGDIQYIPDNVGTAEYIDVDLNKLTKQKAKYVIFTCNAFTNGSLSPNLVVGWMNSKYPMHITKRGVAYNPTQVQHQVKIQNTLSKGMVFGVLDVQNRQIIWLEMGFNGQVVRNLDNKGVMALLNKLDSKLKIGKLLKLKAKVQGSYIVENQEEADEVYDMKWALNTAQVSKELLG